MRVSWNWLADFVDLAGLEPEQVADRLTMSGMEVEGVSVVGGDLDTVVVGRVVECRPHPEADKLSVCRVDVGAADPLEIVCGAPNVATGVRAPVALLGTTMPGGFAIKKAKIRGVESSGMLCSESELGLSDESSGLLLLGDDATPGSRIADVLGLRDVVLEISLTPNRADGLSIRGVAREVAALFGRALREVAATPLASRPPTVAVSERVAVGIEDPAGCARYACVAVRGIRVGPSPEWMQRRLLAVGQRPVNNIVDVTNYVLFEQGQPLHAFDLQRVRGGRIAVRRARAGESIESIDHVRRPLDASDLLICDGEGPVAIAGVMGGAESEIGDATTEVLIECANFDPGTVRRTARRHGMHTESSHRFERGVDVERVPAVLERTLDLIVATQQALGVECEVLSGIVDAYPRPYASPVVRMRVGEPARILGFEVDADTVLASLRSLGIDAALDGALVEARIPAFRPDLERPIDLVEEVGRVVGYDALPSTPLTGALGIVPVRRADAPPREQAEQPVRSAEELEAVERVRGALVGAGLYEAVNWGMVDPARDTLFAGDTGALRLRNPLGDERSAMRRSLMLGLLDNVAHNVAHGVDSVGLFEMGRVYPAGPIADQNAEPAHLGAVFFGAFERHWSVRTRPVDGHDVVGVALGALRAGGIAAEVVAGAPAGFAHPGVYARIRVAGTDVGWVGRLHPDVVDHWQVDGPVYGFEVDLDACIALGSGIPKYAPVRRTPRSTRDAALLVDAAVPYSEVRAGLAGFDHKLLESVELFDVFTGGNLPAGRKSIALRATYRDPAGTLTDDQVDKVHSKLLRHLEHATGAVLRT